MLSDAMVASLASAPFADFLRSVPSGSLCVLNFLRGGLIFDLSRALFRALDARHHSTCFMSSQRTCDNGLWTVHESMYRKLRVPNDGILVVGDVVATGSTLKHGMRVLLDHLVQARVALKGVVFFTIGGSNLERLLEDSDSECRRYYPGYQETHAVYLEGRMHLVREEDDIPLGEPGTDLIRKGALLAPEFVSCQNHPHSAVLERCVIYDAGSRAFDCANYLRDVLHYWRHLAGLARSGMTFEQRRKQLWPEGDVPNPGKTLQTIAEERIRIIENLFEEVGVT